MKKESNVGESSQSLVFMIFLVSVHLMKYLIGEGFYLKKFTKPT